MTSLIVEPKNENDLQLLESLLDRLGLEYHTGKSSLPVKEGKADGSMFWEKIKDGIRASSWDDPLKWQKEIRQDRSLPGRN